MNIQEQIENYLSSQESAKRQEMETIHKMIQKLAPKSKLWFLDGKDAKGKVVTNPNIGYGEYIIRYADGKTKAFYQVGLSGNTTGISVYIMGLEDKTYLIKTFGKTIGKASVTGYCIKFKTLKDIHVDVLESALKIGLGLQPL